MLDNKVENIKNNDSGKLKFYFFGLLRRFRNLGY